MATFTEIAFELSFETGNATKSLQDLKRAVSESTKDLGKGLKDAEKAQRGYTKAVEDRAQKERAITKRLNAWKKNNETDLKRHTLKEQQAITDIIKKQAAAVRGGAEQNKDKLIQLAEEEVAAKKALLNKEIAFYEKAYDKRIAKERRNSQEAVKLEAEKNAKIQKLQKSLLKQDAFGEIAKGGTPVIQSLGGAASTASGQFQALTASISEGGDAVSTLGGAIASAGGAFGPAGAIIGGLAASFLELVAGGETAKEKFERLTEEMDSITEAAGNVKDLIGDLNDTLSAPEPDFDAALQSIKGSLDDVQEISPVAATQIENLLNQPGGLTETSLTAITAKLTEINQLGAQEKAAKATQLWGSELDVLRDQLGEITEGRGVDEALDIVRAIGMTQEEVNATMRENQALGDDINEARNRFNAALQTGLDAERARAELQGEEFNAQEAIVRVREQALGIFDQEIDVATQGIELIYGAEEAEKRRNKLLEGANKEIEKTLGLMTDETGLLDEQQQAQVDAEQAAAQTNEAIESRKNTLEEMGVQIDDQAEASKANLQDELAKTEALIGELDAKLKLKDAELLANKDIINQQIEEGRILERNKQLVKDKIDIAAGGTGSGATAIEAPSAGADSGAAYRKAVEDARDALKDQADGLRKSITAMEERDRTARGSADKERVETEKLAKELGITADEAAKLTDVQVDRMKEEKSLQEEAKKLAKELGITADAAMALAQAGEEAVEAARAEAQARKEAVEAAKAETAERERAAAQARQEREAREQAAYEERRRQHQQERDWEAETQHNLRQRLLQKSTVSDFALAMEELRQQMSSARRRSGYEGTSNLSSLPDFDAGNAIDLIESMSQKVRDLQAFMAQVPAEQAALWQPMVDQFESMVDEYLPKIQEWLNAAIAQREDALEAAKEELATRQELLAAYVRGERSAAPRPVSEAEALITTLEAEIESLKQYSEQAEAAGAASLTMGAASEVAAQDLSKVEASLKAVRDLIAQDDGLVLGLDKSRAATKEWDQNLQDLNDALNDAKTAHAKAVEDFGPGSKEAEKAGDAVKELEGSFVGLEEAARKAKFKAAMQDFQEVADFAGAALDGMKSGIESVQALGQAKTAGEAIGSGADLLTAVGQTLLKMAPGTPLGLAGAVILAAGMVGKGISEIVGIFAKEEETALDRAERRAAEESRINELYQKRLDLLNLEIEAGNVKLDQAKEQYQAHIDLINAKLRELGIDTEIFELNRDQLRQDAAGADDRIKHLIDLVEQADRILERGSHGSRESFARKYADEFGIDYVDTRSSRAMVEDIKAAIEAELKTLETDSQRYKDLLQALNDLEADQKAIIEEQVGLIELKVRLGGDELSGLKEIAGVRRMALNEALREALGEDVGRMIGTMGDQELIDFLREEAAAIDSQISPAIAEMITQWIDASEAVEEYAGAEGDLFSRRKRMLELQRDLEEISGAEFVERMEKLLRDRIELLEDEYAQLVANGAATSALLDNEIARMELELEIKNLLADQNEDMLRGDQLLTRLVRQRQRMLEQMRVAGGPASPAEQAQLQAATDAAVARMREIGATEEQVQAFLAALPQYKEGGFIPQEGPKILHPGEFVLPSDVVSALGRDQLERMLSNRPSSLTNSVAARMITAGATRRDSLGAGGVTINMGGLHITIQGSVSDGAARTLGQSAGDQLADRVTSLIQQGLIEVKR